MPQPHIVHCSYHKCLTVYYGRVMHGLFNRVMRWGPGYRHYNSHLQDFYQGFSSHRVASVNNRVLDLDQFEDFRISRFVRDPRDLVVSGYFYHRRGAEPWTNLQSPTQDDWYFANGVIPEGMCGTELSFAEYLQTLPVEEGLLAELEFRRSHFQSMAEWPKQHRNIVLYRYEDILGNERRVWRDLFEFYGMPPLERTIGHWFARRYAAASLSSHPHVRNPVSGQWREHFTPRVRRAFDAEYAGLLRELGYPTD